eukprot:gene19901-10091_t
MLLLPLLLWPISPLGHPFPQRWWERGIQLKSCPTKDSPKLVGHRPHANLSPLSDGDHSVCMVDTYDVIHYYTNNMTGGGYDPSLFFSGLAGSNYTRVTPNIGGEAEWHTFIDAAHARNITVTSFWNPSYFWTGSPYVKQAEADVRTHGLQNLPMDSPARWFRWSPHKAKLIKPPDDQPVATGSWDWVYDPDANA